MKLDEHTPVAVMMQEPSVSVVIPTYNRRQLVGRAIDSVLDQSVQPAEVIVVDDGSTDDTADYLNRQYGDRIRLLRQANRGVSAARNTGILAAEGDLLAFVDSDDRWLPGKLALQLPVMTDRRIVLSYASLVVEPPDVAGFEHTRTHQSRLIEQPLVELCRSDRPWIHLGACIMRRDIVRRVGMFDERLRIAEDTQLLYRLAFEGAFASMPDVLYAWNLAEDRGLRLTYPEDDAYQRIQTDAAVEILMAAYARASSLAMIEALLIRIRLADLLATQALTFAKDGSCSLARRKGIEALAFGARGRPALRAVAAMTSPHLYARIAARRTPWRSGA